MGGRSGGRLETFCQKGTFKQSSEEGRDCEPFSVPNLARIHSGICSIRWRDRGVPEHSQSVAICQCFHCTEWRTRIALDAGTAIWSAFCMCSHFVPYDITASGSGESCSTCNWKSMPQQGHQVMGCRSQYLYVEQFMWLQVIFIPHQGRHV